MIAPDLTNKTKGLYSVTLHVAAMRDDPKKVLAARHFVFDAYAVGNDGGAGAYARALSAYFWSTGNREQSELFAAYGADAA